MAFIVLHLLLNQRVQKKVHDELDAFLADRKEHQRIDKCAPIKLIDRQKLTYLNAVIFVCSYALKIKF